MLANNGRKGGCFSYHYPFGLAALLTPQFYSTSEIIMIDIDANRLEVAKTFGATKVIDNRVISGTVQPKQLITHHFSLTDIMDAYDTFGNAMRERTLKVIVTNDQAVGATAGRSIV